MTRKLLLAALLVAALLALPAAVSAYDNELSVAITEEIDVSAESDGAYTWNYDATGGNISLIVTNEQSAVGTGNADTRLFDIWVPIDDHYTGGHILSGAKCIFSSNDTVLQANRCGAQVCVLSGVTPMTVAACYCMDFDWEAVGSTTSLDPLDPTKTAALYYNPQFNGSNLIGPDFGYVIHINELQGDTYANLSCSLSAANLGIREVTYPIVFSEKFSPRKIVNKVCAPVAVELNVTSNSTCDLYVTVEKELSSDPAWSNLTFASGTYDSVSDDLKRANWTVTLAAGDTETLTFVVDACPNMTGNTSKLEMGRAYVNFTVTDPTCMNSTFWNVSIGHVTAVGPGELNVSKEHYINSDPPDWAENSTFYDSTADLNYTIYRFRLWAENGTDPSTVDPNDPAITGSEHNCTGLPAGLAAGGTFECDGETFTVDDIPVVFGQPVFELVEGGISGWDDYYLFENSKNLSNPLGSDYFLIENMWVINGYLVKAIKTVTPASTPGCYNVTIEVKNLGETCTPYLYVYDIVPEEFYNMSGNGINGNTSPWNVLVSSVAGSNGTNEIARPGNAQALTADGVYDISAAWLLAYATPPVITENWTLGTRAGTFNDSQYTGKTTGLTGTFAGTGYRWELFPMTGAGGAGDDECPAGLYSNLEVTASATVYITYAICADTMNMTYYPSELFIVGIDPTNAEGAAAPLASVGFGSGEKSGEPLLMVFLAVLAVIAAAFFIKRRRE